MIFLCSARYNSYSFKEKDIATYVPAYASNSRTYTKYPSWVKYDNIVMSPIDTITHPYFYSNSAIFKSKSY